MGVGLTKVDSNITNEGQIIVFNMGMVIVVVIVRMDNT